MRVLHILTGVGRGGAEAAAVKLSERLPGQHFLTLMPGGELRPRLGADWVDRGRFIPTSRDSVVLPILQLWRIWLAPPDIIMSWMYHADFMAVFLGVFLRVPVVWNVRNSLDAANVFKPRTQKLLRCLAILSRLLQVPAVSNSRRAVATHIRHGYQQTGWVYIPNGFFLDRFGPSQERYASFRKQHELPQNARIVACVGRFDPQKNYARFFRLAARLASWADNVYFVAVGRGVLMENPQVAALVSDAQIRTRIVLLGEVSETALLYPAFDVLCVTSDAEGFPNVVGEAMASAVPCVCTDVGDCGDIVGNTGFVVSASADEGLFDAVKIILSETATERMYRGLAARARIAQHYDERIVAARYNGLFRGILQRTAGIVI